MASATIKAKTRAQMALGVCRLCLVDKSARPDELFTEFEDVSHLTQELSGLVEDENNRRQKVCEGCLNELHAALRFRKRIQLMQVVWRKYRNPADSSEGPSVLDEDDDIEMHCHVCNELFESYGKLVDHIAWVHKADGHLLDCGLCETIRNRRILLNGQLVSEDNSFQNIQVKQEGAFTSVGDLNNPMDINSDDEPDDEMEDDNGSSVDPLLVDPDYLPSPSNSQTQSDPEEEQQEDDINVRSSRRPVDPLNRKSFSCTLCPKLYTRRAKLKNHFKQTHKENEERLQDGTYYSQISLAKRMPVHTSLRPVDPFDQKPYSCTLCPKSYTRLEKLNDHLKGTHKVQGTSSQESQYTCTDCGKEYRTQRAFDTHILSHNPTPFQCKSCLIPFSIRGDRNKHESHCLVPLPVDVEGRQTFKCRTCGLSLSSEEEAVSHRVQVHAQIKAASTCTVCQKTFFKPQALARHMESHGEKVYPCKQCDKKYASAGAVVNHAQRVHIANWKSLVCTVCGQKLSRVDKLKQHMKQHTGYSCSLCTATFKTKRLMEEHKKTHYVD